jgi:hypothetical protein
MIDKMLWLGWFDEPNAPPAYDPPIDSACPVCLRTLAKPMVSISVLGEGGAKCWFFRVHKHCANTKGTDAVESTIIDAEAKT